MQRINNKVTIFSLTLVILSLSAVADNPQLDRFGNVRCDLTSIGNAEIGQIKIEEAYSLQRKQQAAGIPSGIAFYGYISNYLIASEAMVYRQDKPHFLILPFYQGN